MTILLRIGPKEPIGAVTECTAGAPCLLAIEPPPPFYTAGTGAYVGQVRAGVGFAPGLRPQDLCRRHGLEEAGFLFLGSQFKEGGGQQEDAVLGDPCRGATAVVFLFEYEPFHQGSIAPPVF